MDIYIYICRDKERPFSGVTKYGRDKERPFSGVTKYGRDKERRFSGLTNYGGIWRKGVKSDAWSELRSVNKTCTVHTPMWPFFGH